MDSIRPTSRISQVQNNATLPEKVAEQLRGMVLRGELAPSAQLPTEPDLSRALNVSRATLRAAPRLEPDPYSRGWSAA